MAIPSYLFSLSFFTTTDMLKPARAEKERFAARNQHRWRQESDSEITLSPPKVWFKL